MKTKHEKEQNKCLTEAYKLYFNMACDVWDGIYEKRLMCKEEAYVFYNFTPLSESITRFFF
ncbi:hypothetical protein Hanom_Chr12g01112581 [Helianthus anomalus]